MVILSIFYAVSCALLIAALYFRPSFFIVVCSVFLFLGFAAKLFAHQVFDVTLIEPTGYFDGTAQAWERALSLSAAGLTGCLVAVLLGAILRHKRRPEIKLRKQLRRHGLFIYALSWMTAIIVFVVGYHFSILKMGVLPTIELNPRIYVPVAFTMSWGAILWLLSLTTWLVTEKRLSPVSIFYVGAIEGSLAAVAIGSRVQMILHLLAATLLYFSYRAFFGWRLRYSQWVKVFALSATLFGISIAAVTLDRALSFPSMYAEMHAPSTGNPVESKIGSGCAADETLKRHQDHRSINNPNLLALNELKGAEFQSALLCRLQPLLRELQNLIIMRWVGLEGIMVTSSTSMIRSPDLFWSAIVEKDQGVNSLYQRMARTRYFEHPKFAFMTVPGPLAVLSYSGSPIVVFFGMLMLFLVGFAIERYAFFATQNPGAEAVTGTAMAYLLVQMMFPRTLVAAAVLFLFALTCIAAFRFYFRASSEIHSTTS